MSDEASAIVDGSEATEQPAESWNDASKRIRREGRYPDFRRRRLTIFRAMLKAKIPKYLAKRKAWRQAIEEFPPEPALEAEVTALELEAKLAMAPKVERRADRENLGPDVDPKHEGFDMDAPIDLVRDLLWVYNNIDNARVKVPRHAPSPGAWSFLRQVRSSQSAKSEFYRTWLPKLINPKLSPGAVELPTEAESEPAVADEGIEDMKAMLKGAIG